MDTQDLNSGSVDTIGECTANLDSTVLARSVADENGDEESHEGCGTGLLFQQKYRFVRTKPVSGEPVKSPDPIPSLNTISGLRLGAAADCHNFKIVLDAIISYGSGRLSIDNIERIQVLSGERPITIIYRPGLDAGEGSNESGLRKAELELFQLEGQTAHVTRNYSDWGGPIPTRKLPSEDTSSDQALQTLYNWIDTCVEHHDDCAGRKITALPKRILEIEGTHVYLRERVNKNAMYACLSHCWGAEGPTIRLDKKSFGHLRDGIIIDQLPKTFAHAAQLCKRLGISFLWIDACCIMQDDRDDWEEAAASMANIYEQAHLTIAATWASNSDSGLFASDRERYKARKLRSWELYVREKPEKLPLPTHRSTGFPLLTRAWVYQERFLSSRMVHFGKDQMFWQCSTLFVTESGSTFEEHYSVSNCMSDASLRSDDDPVSRWRRIVTAYSRLELTYANDRLPAIAAIVEREMRLRKDDTYIAGMWTSSLLTDLLWTAGNAEGSPSLPRLPNSIPTWSWLSSRDSIGWHNPPIMPSLRLVDLSFTRVGPPQIGEVANASITLEGRTCMTQLTHIRDPEARVSSSYMATIPPLCAGEGLNMLWFMEMDFDWTTGDRPVTIGDTFTFLLVISCPRNAGSHFGLVLREMTDGRFMRMGAMHCDVAWGDQEVIKERCKITSDFLEALPIRQVTII